MSGTGKLRECGGNVVSGALTTDARRNQKRARNPVVQPALLGPLAVSLAPSVSFVPEIHKYWLPSKSPGSTGEPKRGPHLK